MFSRLSTRISPRRLEQSGKWNPGDQSHTRTIWKVYTCTCDFNNKGWLSREKIFYKIYFHIYKTFTPWHTHPVINTTVLAYSLPIQIQICVHAWGSGVRAIHGHTGGLRPQGRVRRRSTGLRGYPAAKVPMWCSSTIVSVGSVPRLSPIATSTLAITSFHLSENLPLSSRVSLCIPSSFRRSLYHSYRPFSQTPKIICQLVNTSIL